MKKSVITKEGQYNTALARAEVLLKLVGNNTATDDKNFIELDELSEAIAKYEEKNYTIPKPSLQELIELRMFERKLSQKSLAELLGTNTARVSEYLKGKREITLKVAKALYQKLNIDPEIILGT